MGFAYKPIRFDDLNAVNSVKPCPGIITSFPEIAKTLEESLPVGLILVDGFPSANFSKLINQLENATREINFVDVASLQISPDQIKKQIEAYMPKDREVDPDLIFAKLYDGEYEDFLDKEKVSSFLDNLKPNQTVLLYGLGSAAAIFRKKAKALLFIDVTPKDTALRVFDDRYQSIGNLHADNFNELVRQTYFIDVALAVGLRREIIRNNLLDYYLLDSEVSFNLLSKQDLLQILKEIKQKPFRAKPVYVEGVWGGQFLKRLRGIPQDLVDKVAWSFELIHTEASLLIDVGAGLIDIPYLTVMDAVGESIIGKEAYAHFDGYLPIRFNYDDTWHSNGNMSIQCHPNDQMCKDLYGDFAGQNEAYYVVQTGHDAKTFCGFKGDPQEFLEQSRRSETSAELVPYEDYVHAIPSHVGRQILLPTGTIHGSGRNQVVLELGTLTISAYTYKIYDYTRMDITGKPRPLHTKLAEEALVFERDANWVMENIAFDPILLEEGNGWRELLVGQYKDIYFQTHRIEMDTGSSYRTKQNDAFTVLTVVDGEGARIQSVDNPDFHYKANYLDVIMVPASIAEYEVISQGKQPVVLHKAFVRKETYQNE